MSDLRTLRTFFWPHPPFCCLDSQVFFESGHDGLHGEAKHWPTTRN
jgi:hypothetical protein